MDVLISEIRQELERVCGGGAVQCFEVETAPEVSRRVRLETSDAVYELPAKELLTLLRKLPDHTDVMAVREAIEETFRSTSPE